MDLEQHEIDDLRILADMIALNGDTNEARILHALLNASEEAATQQEEIDTLESQLAAAKARITDIQRMAKKIKQDMIDRELRPPELGVLVLPDILDEILVVCEENDL